MPRGARAGPVCRQLVILTFVARTLGLHGIWELGTPRGLPPVLSSQDRPSGDLGANSAAELGQSWFSGGASSQAQPPEPGVITEQAQTQLPGAVPCCSSQVSSP